MHGGSRDLEITRTRAHRVDRGPWAVALNEAAATDDITVTLPALAVVDEVIRVSGIVHLIRRSDLRLSNVPAPTLATLDGAPLGLLRAHALPNGAMSWVSWTYGRPAEVCTGYEGRIDRIDLAYGARSVVREGVPGPWAFGFCVPNGSGLGGRSHRYDSIGEA
jgi:hypothetical protein